MVARELGKCNLDLVSVQEVRYEMGGSYWAEDCTFFLREGNEDYQLGTGFFCILSKNESKLITSPVSVCVSPTNNF
jgi:hypothetical protein